MFGNKAANLLVLQRLLDERLAHQGLAFAVRVPHFVPLSHETVLAHLHAHSPQFADLWRQFVRIQRDRTVLSHDAKAVLQSLRRLCRTAFATPLSSLAQWLEPRRDARLMVRSTGREDSDTLANAGGNQSIANVPWDIGAVSRAIGDVVASYFSERSLGQRLAAGDCIVSAPFVPVLLQVMVGETSETGIPCSGVAFTREQGASTTNILQTQATWGHNEAVVASLAPCDTYYVDEAEHTHAVIRPKPERLQPDSAAGELRRSANPPSHATAATLRPREVRDVARVCRMIAQAYGKPMDIEWTYMPKERTLYLLQARPLVERTDNQPTHINPLKVEDCGKLTAAVIGSGGGKVCVLQNAGQALFAAHLRDALSGYLGSGAKPQAVFVANRAEPTSHEATTFRGEGIPVLHMDDLSEIRQLVERGPVLVDTCTGQVVDASSLLRGVRGATAEGHLRECGVILPGWGKHPIPAVESMGRSGPAVTLMQTRRLYLQLLHDMDPDAERDAGRRLTLPTAAGVEGLVREMDGLVRGLGGMGGFRAVVRDVASPCSPRRAVALATALCRAHQLTRRLSADAALAPRAMVLFQRTLRACCLIAQHHDDPVRCLYEANWLVAALDQPSDASTLASDSYKVLLGELRERQRVHTPTSDVRPGGDAADLATARDFQVVAMRMGKVAMRPEVATAWQHFVDALVSHRSLTLNQRLSALLVAVHDLGIATPWLNQAFAREWSKSCAAGLKKNEAVRCLNALERGLESGPNGAALRWTREHREVLRQWQGSIDQWSDPARFAELHERFRKDFADSLGRGAALQLFAAADALGRSALLSWYRTATTVLDLSIKSISGSTAYTDPRLKARHIAQLMDVNMALMNQWARGIEEVWNYRGPIGFTFNFYRVDRVVEQFNRMFADLRSQVPAWSTEVARTNLQPSKRFDVAAAQICSNARFVRHRPSTLEDMLTLCHQNILMSLGIAASEYCTTPNLLPSPVQTVCDQLQLARLPGFASAPHIVATEVDYPVTAVTLNAPLRNHSATVQVRYDMRRPTHVAVSMHIFGRARFAAALEYAKGCAADGGFTFAKGGEPAFQQDVSGTFTWDIPVDSEKWPHVLRALPEYMYLITAATFTAPFTARRPYRITQKTDAREVSQNLRRAHRVGPSAGRPRGGAGAATTLLPDCFLTPLATVADAIASRFH